MEAILFIMLLGTLVLLTAMLLNATVKAIYWYIIAIINEPVYRPAGKGARHGRV